MAKIYCLVGESSSGKDTVFRRLLDKNKNLTPIITYTTRPIRPKEKNGKEYYFVDKKVFSKLKNNNKIIESRIYKTIHGNWIYFMANDGQIDINSNKKYLLINTLEGASKLKELYHDDLVIIHIWVEDSVRILRAFAREMNGKNDYVEMCRRFVTDNKDFSPENFMKLGLNENRVENENIVECVDNIIDIIK